ALAAGTSTPRTAAHVPANRGLRRPRRWCGRPRGFSPGAPGQGRFPRSPQADEAFGTPERAADGRAPPWPLLIWFFNACEARNTRTRRGLIGTSCPVLGLRPTRCPFWRTAKLPKDEILTISPRSSAWEISAITDSTSSADSFRDSPTS